MKISHAALTSLLASAAAWSAAASAWAEDPTALGPFAVSTARYDRGDTAFECSAGILGCSVCTGDDPSCPGGELAIPNFELRAEVYYPTELGTRRSPLVLFVHGLHAACYEPDFGFPAPGWPCPEGALPIPSYLGYSDAGRLLASHGYIVVSVSANGIHARNVRSSGTGRGIGETARLIEAHLDLWNEFDHAGAPSAGEPFASSFIGHVDLSNVGTLGHSRGGEGVVRHAVEFAPASPYTVRAVLPVAPTNFGREVLRGTPLGVLLGYCDGDVYHLEGLKLFDDARYGDPNDSAAKHTFLALGANHAFFNTLWTPECWQNQNAPGACWSDALGRMPEDVTRDEWDDIGSGDPFCSTFEPDNGRLTPAQQRSLLAAYSSAFFRHYLGGEAQFGPLLRGEESASPSVDPRVYVGYQPPAPERLDLNRLSAPAELSQTTLTGTDGAPGSVFHPEIDPYAACGTSDDAPCQTAASREAHRTSETGERTGMQRVRLGWGPGEAPAYIHELPPGARDVSSYRFVQFRVAVDPEDPVGPYAAPVEFRLILSDSVSSAKVNMSDQPGENDLFFPPGAPENRTSVMNTVRFPLEAFPGIDLRDLVALELRFDGTPSARIFVSDIAFSR